MRRGRGCSKPSSPPSISADTRGRSDPCSHLFRERIYSVQSLAAIGSGDRVMALALAGLGTALPPFSISQEEAAEAAQVVCGQTSAQAALLPTLYRQTGIATRHMVLGDAVVADVLNGTAQSGSEFLPDGAEGGHGPGTRQRMQRYRQESLPLALQAASAALDESGLAPGAITHLVTVSCTGFAAPGVDIGLIKSLHLNPTVERTHVGFMGCHGALNGLRAARAFVEADPDARVLLCAVEICSIHYHFGWNVKKMLANALFADGAAAVVGVPAARAVVDAWRIRASGSCVFPDSEPAMTWNIGDHGFEMTLASSVPRLIGEHLRPWLTGWLGQHDLSLTDIASWAVHPGGPRIVSAVAQGLGLGDKSLAISLEVLQSHGNMSSPTVLFILDRLRREGAPRPCVALGFGPGLAAEAALFV